MWPREKVIATLRARGELWEPVPGVTVLRGDIAQLSRALDRAIGTLCEVETTDDWRVPPAIDFASLTRAEYFASFPQWLTAACHLRDDVDSLRSVAADNDPSLAVREALARPRAVLNPAVCYHVYAGLAGTVIDAPRLVTAQGACWRHESSHAPLERGWAFTMREIVCLGSMSDARAFLVRTMDRVWEFMRMLGLHGAVEVATDPFFAPAARAKQLLQQLMELKHELLLPIDARHRIAAASFNLHGPFFGDAFDITLPTGEPATTACVAFGLERWLLAFLVRYGPDASGWPSLPANAREAEDPQLDRAVPHA
jgi:seryl-tRNA synthetase